jgi:outer membrane protein TolC
VDANQEQAIQAALSRRADVLASYSAAKAALARVRAAKAEFLPKLFVSATGSYNSGQAGISAIPLPGAQPPTLNLSGDRLGGALLAGVSVPLYDSGLRAASLVRAEAAADSAARSLEQIRIEAARQIAAAENALCTDLEAAAAARELEAAAQTTFSAAIAAYRGGAGAITDANIAEAGLLQARDAVTDATGAARTAAATLALALGAMARDAILDPAPRGDSR